MNYVDEKELLEYFKEEYNQEEVWLIILEWKWVQLGPKILKWSQVKEVLHNFPPP